MRTAFVLAGGGSFGAVQVGMLRELLAHGVVPDLVVGASAGAINGAYLAGNPTPEGVARLEAIWRGLRRSDVFPIGWRSLMGVLGRRNFMVEPDGLRRLHDVFFVVHRQEHQRATKATCTQRAGHVETANPRHRDVEHDHVRAQPIGGLERRGAVGDGGDDLAAGREQRRRAAQHGLVVIDEQHAGRLRRYDA